MNIRELQNKNELNQAILLANDVFFQGRQQFQFRYPHVFNEANLKHLYGLFENEMLISFIATFPSRLEVSDNESISCVMLGAVCTHQNYQGQGLSNQLLMYVKEKCTQNQVQLLFISGTGKNYIRLGAKQVGQLIEVHVDLSLIKKIVHKKYVIHEKNSLELTQHYEKKYQNMCYPRFKRDFYVLKDMLDGHFFTFENESCVVLESKTSIAIVRIGYEGTTKLIYLIEYVGHQETAITMSIHYGKNQNCDRLFARMTETYSLAAATLIHTPISGTCILLNSISIRENVVHSIDQVFSNITHKGAIPSVKVDDLNFL